MPKNKGKKRSKAAKKVFDFRLSIKDKDGKPLDQHSFGKLLGRSQPSVCSIENGGPVSWPVARKLIKLADKHSYPLTIEDLIAL